ncbi:MAG: hypothetical protein CMN87_21770 [Stappia sp.]|uniref:DUF5368 family protein n=1 Tax=Stappia sp. TaxID=1870903 RepID=UPI000C37C025|nr:DUF5368 family protein [Stappia sp.]MAA97644.1 hypothetical protein [Stappia sp.]MBM22635.1 hypothetical protein [Stappia sp.]
MNDLTFGTLIAVFEETFGRGLFWAMVAVAYVYVLIRDRAVSWRKFLLAQLSMPLGAIAAGGAIGTAVLVYTVHSLVRPPSESG